MTYVKYWSWLSWINLETSEYNGEDERVFCSLRFRMKRIHVCPAFSNYYLVEACYFSCAEDKRPVTFPPGRKNLIAEIWCWLARSYIGHCVSWTIGGARYPIVQSKCSVYKCLRGEVRRLAPGGALACLRNIPVTIECAICSLGKFQLLFMEERICKLVYMREVISNQNDFRHHMGIKWLLPLFPTTHTLKMLYPLSFVLIS